MKAMTELNDAPCRGDGSRAGDAAGRRRRDDLAEPPRRQERRSRPITRFDATDQKAKIAGEVKPARTTRTASIPTSASITRSSVRSTRSSSMRSMPPARRSRTPASPTWTSDLKAAHRGLDRLGHRRPAGDRKRIPGARGKRAGPRQPALRPRSPDQPHLRPGLDQIRPDGPQSLRWSPPARPEPIRSATPRG